MTTLSAAKAGEVAHIETEAEWESALADNDVVSSLHRCDSLPHAPSSKNY